MPCHAAGAGGEPAVRAPAARARPPQPPRRGGGSLKGFLSPNDPCASPEGSAASLPSPSSQVPRISAGRETRGCAYVRLCLRAAGSNFVNSTLMSK